VDDTGRIVREVKVASEPEALLPVLTNDAYHFKRIGLEAGSLSQWLQAIFGGEDDFAARPPDLRFDIKNPPSVSSEEG
jgi:hypothetical protein